MSKKMISLFTGAGGLDWGFHNSNEYELIMANEILKPHLKTYTHHYKIPILDIDNYSNEIKAGICGDIHDLNISHETDVLMGGPPCQDFSVLRGDDKRAGFTVKRGKLYEEYLRILKSSKPNIFIFENVVGMVSANKGVAYETIQKDFINAGYDLIFNEILNLTALGAPQARKRLIIIGIKKSLIPDKNKINNIINKYLRNDLLSKYPLTPLETFEGELLKNLTDEYVKIMKEYEGCMNNIDNKYSEKFMVEYGSLTFSIIEDYMLANNIKEFNEMEFKQAMKEHKKILKILGFYQKKIDKQQYLDDSNRLGRKNKNVTERLHHIPPSYNFKAVENTKWKVKGLMSNIYRRLHPLIPSPTVIAYGGGGTGGYHYKYNRQGLTNRERARLQTFPDNYLFNGTTSEVRAQIGEAVPPIASYWISKTVTDILNII
ncbi:DNA cytosine methyltransferase [uncultured Methanobrevibacter sp.]|uniref:DNA cytosine methyltransferase n=1 Tax=uncultured Methanobrevibacter sp. TaxID=253161 RepID=UPI0026E04ED9|nr:DNA cytosine methyltransferase [uncultured Methanobrevibacter sp.]